MQQRLIAAVGTLGVLAAACGGSAGGDDDAAAGTPSSFAGGTAKGGSAGQAAGGRSAAAGGTDASGTGGTGGTNAEGGTAGGGGSAAATSGGTGAGGASSGGAGLGGSEGGMSNGGMDAGGRAGMGGRATGGRAGMGGRAMSGAAGEGTAGTSGTSAAGAAGMTSGCPGAGHVTYTLTKSASPTADETQAYGLITTAMDKAVEYYNCYTNITKAETVTYVPSVSTADGNSNGSIRFGGKDYMEYITAMHEISHTVGIGTVTQWESLVVDGVFIGTEATAQLRSITGVITDQVHADSQHFWPYGLNYTSEVKSEADVINHCYMVVAIRTDMGLKEERGEDRVLRSPSW